MSKISAMTIGLVLILLGVQLFLVKSYWLSPKTARLMAEHFNESPISQSNESTPDPSSASALTWPFYQAQSAFNSASENITSSLSAPLSTLAPKRIAPPRWIRWAVFFLGAVFFLHGAALRGEE